MTTDELRVKAERLRALHAGPRILVLCNAWDAASARLVEEAGFPAIATTSAGIANSLGYPDGQRIPRGEMAAAVARITRAVAVPVSADMEAGYGPTPEAAAETARAALAAGAVGMNFEDATEERDFIGIELQCERIQAAREASAKAGVPLVLNARTDVYLARAGDPEKWFGEAVRRVNAYRAAGADCLFVPGAYESELIARLVREIDGPLNILAGPTAPPIPELERLGVRRVSVGSGPMRATMTLLRKVAGELNGTGTYTSFTKETISYTEANQLFDSSSASR
jgi:2-methylisocitrate lyase-like PEP mutase family enzyme